MNNEKISEATHVKFRLFVACTQELDDERNKIHLVANELNKTIADALGIVLEVVDWKTHISSMMGRPQQVLFDQLPVNTWDIFIGMLWLRFGTSSGGINPATNLPFSSGTEEEFTLAYELWESTGKPQILFYRCSRAVPPDRIDPEQIQKLKDFFSAFDASGGHPGFVSTYDTIEAFEKKVQADITRILLAYSDQKQIRKASESLPINSSTARLPLDKGFLRFFTPEVNNERNQKKMKALSLEAKSIRLLAHVGYSYLAKVGNRFGKEILTSLDIGAHFQVLILNPWTETGLMIAIGEADQQVNGLNLDEIRVDFSRLDVISFIQNSTYYRYSLLQVLDEYEALRKEYGNQIELRLTTYDIPATILLTTTTGFFEPYISVNLKQRLRKALHTFEIQYGNECYFYHNTSTYFNTLWMLSINYEEFTEREEEFKQRLRAIYSMSNKN